MQSKTHLKTKFIEILTQENLTIEARADLLIDAARPVLSLTAQQEMVRVLAEVMLVDASLNGARLARLAADLGKQGATPQLLRSRYGRGGWFYRTDWRGKRGEFPNEKALRETFGRWDTKEMAIVDPYVDEN